MARNRELSKFGSFVGVTSSSIGIGIATTSSTTPPFVGIGTTVATQLFQVGAATSAFVVTGIGSVGIGTTNPVSRLNVLGLTSTTDLVVTGVATLSALNVGAGGTIITTTAAGLVGIGTTVPLQRLQIGTANTLGISTDNNIFVVTGLGSVGVGTTNPVSRLNVLGLTSTTDLVVTGVTTTARLNVGTAGTIITTTTAGLVGIGTTVPLQKLQIGTANTLGISTDGNVFVVTGLGSVGVGTTNPVSRLNVLGLTSTTDLVVTGISTIITELDVGVGGTIFTALPSGRIGIGTTNPIQQFQIGSASTLGISTDGSIFVVTGLGSVGVGTTNPLGRLQVGIGSTAFIVGAGGSVGIGTTNPQARLHIVGSGVTVGFGLTALQVTGGQTIIPRVAITTIGAITTAFTLEAGRIYAFFNASTNPLLTLPSSPVAGDRVEILNRSGVTTAVLDRGGQFIMGLAENLELDSTVAFKVTYSGIATEGWLVST